MPPSSPFRRLSVHGHVVARTIYLVLCLSVLAGPLLEAQDPDTEPPPPPGLYTLHVYTNLVQVPTLVLNSNNKPVSSLTRTQFSIALDGGPLFHPTQMRLEGEDPVSLGILIDASGGEEELVQKLPAALAGLAPQYLHPSDQLMLFALDCKLVHSTTPIPASASGITKGLTAVLRSPGLHGEKSHGSCSRTTRLWDSIISVDNVLKDMPGRRVLLIISSGNDHQSQTSFQETQLYSGFFAIAIFGMRDPDGPLIGEIPNRSDVRHGGLTAGTLYEAADSFDLLCRTNGGLLLNVRSWTLAQSLQSFITMLRGRYILEFPRPDNSTAGNHNIDITLPGKNALILATGVATPLPDPALLADPNTVPVAPSPAQMGTHKPASHTP